MPYLAPEEEPILTPEEQAALDAQNAAIVTGAGGGNAPIPPPPTDTTLVPAGTPPPPTQTVTYPTAGVQNNPAGAPEYVTGYGEQVPVASPYEPVPDPIASGADAVPTTWPTIRGYGETTDPATGQKMWVDPVKYTPIPRPTPSSPTINARASDYTALGLDPTEYLRRSYGPPPEPAPLYPNALGGRGPLGPEYVNAKSVGGMGDLGAGARWAPPDRINPTIRGYGTTVDPDTGYAMSVDPARYTPINQAWGRQDDSRPIPPPPTTNWWDPLTNAAGNVLPGLVQWATPGLDPGPANSARQAQDAVGSLVGAFRDTPVQQTAPDQLNRSLGVNQDAGISWDDLLSWRPFGGRQSNQIDPATGKPAPTMLDAGFIWGPDIGPGPAGVADDLARAGNTIDDAARTINGADEAIPPPAGVGYSTASMPDGTFRVIDNITGEPLPGVYKTYREAEAAGPVHPDSLAGQKRLKQGLDPATGKPLAEPEPVVDTAGSTPGGPNAAPVSGSTVASGAKPGASRLPRITRGKLAATGAGAVVAAGIANNVIQTGRSGGANQPAGGKTGGPSGTQRQPLEPGVYSPSTNPSTPDEWANASTRSLQLMVQYPEGNKSWFANTETTHPIQDADGVWRTGVTVKGLVDSKGNPLYVGFIDANNNIVPVGNDVSDAEFRAALRNAAASDAPVDTPNQAVDSSGTSSGLTLDDVSIPSPDGSSGGSSGKNSDWNNDYGGSSGGSYRSGRGSSRSSGSDDGYDREFTAEDFMDAAGGDRKKAQMMARVANKRRRGKRKGTTASGTPYGFWEGFPFNRPPTPIREHVLTAIQESRANGSKR